MAMIRLEALPSLAETLGLEAISEEVVPDGVIAAGYSVRELLIRLSCRYRRLEQLLFDPRDHNLSGEMIIFLNGRSLGLRDGLETRLKDGDTLTFIPYVEGG